jgi:hypothetical protein
MIRAFSDEESNPSHSPTAPDGDTFDDYSESFQWSRDGDSLEFNGEGPETKGHKNCGRL